MSVTKFVLESYLICHHRKTEKSRCEAFALVLLRIRATKCSGRCRGCSPGSSGEGAVPGSAGDLWVLAKSHNVLKPICYSNHRENGGFMGFDGILWDITMI